MSTFVYNDGRETRDDRVDIDRFRVAVFGALHPMSTSGEAFEVDHLGEVASTRAPQYVRFNFPAFMPLRNTKSSASWKQFNPIWASPWTQEKLIFDTKEISKLVFRLTQLRQAKLKPCQISIRSVLTPLEIADAGQLVEMSLKLCSRGCRNGE